MIRLAVLCLLLTGCGGPRCINPGADWEIYVANRADLTAEFIKRGGDLPSNMRQDGFTDRQQKQIWVVGSPADAPVLRRFAHEMLAHGPDHPLARITGPTWDPLYGDADPMDRAAAMAMMEAQKAKR